MNVVIVESLAKAKTINKYLGSDYKVFASFGHVRDLPAKKGSVLPDNDFAIKWSINNASEKLLSKIAQAVKESESLILATDPDREGEAISWHVLDILQQRNILKGKKIKRVIFNAITERAVLDAMITPRQIDSDLVDAYLARRALDYLVGFTLSPILWRKLSGPRSAGRVQSVALRLICDRESEIESFIREDYWSIFVNLRTMHNNICTARLVSFEGRNLGRFDIKTSEDAQKIRLMLEGAIFHVQAIESQLIKRNPAPPFTTSTLQQMASLRFNFSASHTMQVAQRLYEGIDLGGETAGLITYMRTDSVQIDPQAIDSMRKVINRTFGNDYVPEKPRHYITKAKNAQEAHEAIRPTNFNCPPDTVYRFLDSDNWRLYDLVWKRTIASQMQAADIERTIIEIKAENNGTVANLRVTGSIVCFDGFLALYADTCEDDIAETEENSLLSEIHVHENLRRDKIIVSKHKTEPQARYSEATLIKKLEEVGVGRPSTYAPTLSILRKREYINVEKRRLIPKPNGRILIAFLENFFNRYVEYDFTADLEEKLDLISDGKLKWKDVLRDFWQHFSVSVADIKDLRVTEVLDILNKALAPIVFPPKEDNSEPYSCPLCHIGRLSLKPSRYGAFVGCSNYPECKYSRHLDFYKKECRQKAEPIILGQDSQTGEDVSLRKGRFGFYIQRGEKKESKRISIPKNWQTNDIDLQKASLLLSLPREVGLHPESGNIIKATIGRYGPYINHNSQYINLENIDEVFSIGIERAAALLAKKQHTREKCSVSTTLANLGEHPEGGKVSIQNGRYSPYIKWNKINVSLPKDKDPTSIVLETALALIEAKIAKTETGKVYGKKRKRRQNI